MRTSNFAILLALATFLLTAVLAAPYVGLGGRETFLVYRLFGIPREQCFNWLLILTGVLCYFQLLGISSEVGKESWKGVACSIWQQGSHAAREIFISPNEKSASVEWKRAFIVAVWFTLIALILVVKTAGLYRNFVDTRWHLSSFYYDLAWGTPAFSFGGNLLDFFGIQVPLNANLSPIIGLSFVLAPILGGVNSVELSVFIFFVALSVLMGVLARLFRFRPVPSVVFAGTTAMISTIPIYLPFLPPYVFPLQAFQSGGYWLETSILSLSSACLFYFIGQGPKELVNAALGVGFAALSYTLLLAFPPIAVFAVPVISLYAAAFLLTSCTKREAIWKTAVGGLTGCTMLATHIPAFFFNLYSYAFGPYLFDPPLQWSWTPSPPLSLISIAVYQFFLEPRIPLLFALSLGTMVVLSKRGPIALRRFAIATLSCELGLIALGIANSLIFHIDILSYYAEQVLMPFVVCFFVLFFMAAIALPVRNLATFFIRVGNQRVKEWRIPSGFS